ncbi:hypothetical protein AB3S75_034038 [Citrus x aurantiifolia]
MTWSNQRHDHHHNPEIKVHIAHQIFSKQKQKQSQNLSNREHKNTLDSQLSNLNQSNIKIKLSSLQKY